MRATTTSLLKLIGVSLPPRGRLNIKTSQGRELDPMYCQQAPASQPETIGTRGRLGAPGAQQHDPARHIWCPAVLENIQTAETTKVMTT